MPHKRKAIGRSTLQARKNTKSRASETNKKWKVRLETNRIRIFKRVRLKQKSNVIKDRKLIDYTLHDPGGHYTPK